MNALNVRVTVSAPVSYLRNESRSGKENFIDFASNFLFPGSQTLFLKIILADFKAATDSCFIKLYKAGLLPYFL